ncbi:HupE/UreJ family protein [Oceanicola sp. S124]|uniref:HupE/UreJ family protein n=1 Tax=Oceanicola sp. S124 TaxID=1042378 RepID=UPI000255966D|nr:HupE/UreJ family protein [Oceanicola sp. S124]
MRLKTLSSLTLILAALALQTGAAQAHGLSIEGGFASGFSHPILGWDHVVAMVAVGLWGAVLGRPAIWVLPLVFPLVMALGAAAGILGLPLPAVETGIALSGVVLGLLVALARPAPVWLAAAVTGVFAVFHGHAHGTELPEAAAPLAYGLGFVLGTGLLHLAGIGLGLLWGSRAGKTAVRAAGLLIAAAGGAFLTGVA